MAATTEICVVPECGRPVRCRGLCKQCYEIAMKRVRTGRTTTRKLERKGLLLPRKRSFIAKALDS